MTRKAPVPARRTDETYRPLTSTELDIWVALGRLARRDGELADWGVPIPWAAGCALRHAVWSRSGRVARLMAAGDRDGLARLVAADPDVRYLIPAPLLGRAALAVADACMVCRPA